MKRAGLAVAVLALGACAKPGVPVADGAAPGVRCDADAIQSLVGRDAATVTAEAQRRSGARTVRGYTTGDALTMDFRPDRLNIERDADGKVVKLGCG